MNNDSPLNDLTDIIIGILALVTFAALNDSNPQIQLYVPPYERSPYNPNNATIPDGIYIKEPGVYPTNRKK